MNKKTEVKSNKLNQLYSCLKTFRNKLFKKKEVVLQNCFYESIMLTGQNKVNDAGIRFAEVFNRDLVNAAGLRIEYIKLLLEYASSVRHEQYLPKDLLEAIKKATFGIEVDRLNCDKWLQLCHICLSNGLFHLDPIIRDKAIQAAYIEAELNKDDANLQKKAFKAYIDKADLIKAEETLCRLEKLIDKQLFSKYTTFFKLSSGSKYSIFKYTSESFSNVDCKFRALIAGKTVAVVGPALTESVRGSEIDSFDLVVRISYRGSNTIYDTSRFGSKTDVAYYGNVFSDAISKHGEVDFFKDLDYAVFKTVRHELQIKIGGFCGARAFHSPNYSFFNGSAHMVQNAIFDLLLYEPSRLKLFNMNFFLSHKTHYPNYSSILNISTDNEWKQYGRHANHKYLSSLNFTRNLYNKDVIECDDECRRVLMLSDEEYMSKMFEIYFIPVK